MKRASYREAIGWVAYNSGDDSSEALNPSLVADLVTVGLVASIFALTPERVAQDVIRFRKRRPDWKEAARHD